MANRPIPSGGAIGWTLFAAVMMLLIGSLHIFSGLVGLINDDFYVTGPKYVLRLDSTTWGWIHLIGGVVVLFAGFGLFKGAVWARTVGVIIALISALTSFAWLPHYPIWGITIIAIDIAVIWALTTHGRDIVEDR